MKTYISTLIFNLILCGMVSACSCADKPSIHDNWGYASQVFIGEVVGIDTSGFFYSARGQQVTMFTIRIIESFKLEIFKSFNYRTFINMGGGTCDSYFEIGKKYLIYASGNSINGFLKSSICSRTDLLDRINESEIEQLRKFHLEFKAESELPQLIFDNEIERYELALSKSANEKLSRDKRILLLLSTTLAAVIILTLIIYVIRRKKTNT